MPNTLPSRVYKVQYFQAKEHGGSGKWTTFAKRTWPEDATRIERACLKVKATAQEGQPERNIEYRVMRCDYSLITDL